MHETTQVRASWLVDGTLYVIREIRGIIGESRLTMQVIRKREFAR